jgi:hypothetical protein
MEGRMVEAELLIGHLRRHVRDLQSLLNYLESRDAVRHEDYTYSHSKLRELISRLRGLEKFSEQRGTVHSLRAAWLN